MFYLTYWNSLRKEEEEEDVFCLLFVVQNVGECIQGFKQVLESK